MDDLETSIYVAIRTAKPHVRRGISAKLPHEGDEAAAKLAASIAKALRATYNIGHKPSDASKLPRTF